MNMLRLLVSTALPATLMALVSPTAALADAEEASESYSDDSADGGSATRSSRDIVVLGGIGFRNRENEAAVPTLVYDEDYFQRFEPLTAGDALKRVPSVTFLSDVIESDGARLRGLDPGYTQILINGEKVPGSNADRSFFLDRIPAELVKRVEIVRSSSARRTGDAVAGTLNIVLRDAVSMDGGYVRGGALLFDDGKVKPTGGLYYGGPLGPGRILLGVNIQGRYNPKKKFSQRFSDSPENNPNFRTEDFDNREDQTDTRNGTDYAGNLSYLIEGENTKFEINGNYVRTERVEDERSFEYNDPTAINGPVRAVPPGNLLTDNHNVNDITQESWSISSKLSHEWEDLGETKIRFSVAGFRDRQDEFENEIDFDRARPRFTGDLIARRIKDTEFSAGLEHAFPIGGKNKFVIGGFYQLKDRKTDIAEGRDRFNLTAADRQGYDQFTRSPDEFVRSDPVLAPNPGGFNTIEEQRKDLFALVEGESGPLTYEAGLRWENTSVKIDDFTVPARTRAKYDFLLPSASLKWEIGRGRITASAARTLRRPRLDYLSPALLEAELGDNDLLGNPRLRPETAWGGDLGYEHRIGRTGVVGVNVFYRKVKDLVEIVTLTDPVTGLPLEGSEGEGTFILQPANVGSGQVWGIEFDLSTDLGFIGLPDTGIFGNLGLVDSSVRDFAGKRRFNGQSKYVYNFGFIQNLRSWNAAFGATYRKQGRAFDRIVGEEVFTTYGADLEIFVEKRIGERFTIRAVGSNLLDGSKDERFNKFNTIADQLARDFDEYELETETAGPVFQIIARLAF